MTIFDILSTIRQAGGRVVVLDGDLQVTAPPGAVSVEAAAVLREHKAALIGILPDAEREAVQWVENLSPDKAEALVETARREWEAVVAETPVEPVKNATSSPCNASEPVVVNIEFLDGGGMILYCSTPELAGKIEAGRTHVEAAIAEINGSMDLNDEEIVPPPPCRQCGGFMLWRDFSGSWHCMDCDPAERSAKLREQAERFRRKRRN